MVQTECTKGVLMANGAILYTADEDDLDDRGLPLTVSHYHLVRHVPSVHVVYDGHGKLIDLF